MSEGDSAVGNDSMQEHSEVEDSSNDDEPGSEETGAADELRQKLADMFDLPALSENTESATSDSALESRLDLFRDQPVPEGSTETGGDSLSSWPEPDSDATSEEPAATLDFDLNGAVSAESAEAFESETLDEFPSTDSTVEVEPAVQAEPQTSSSFTPEAEGGEEESITAYMERLLARNRQLTGGSSDSKKSDDSDSVVTSQAVSSKAVPATDNPDAGSVAEEQKSEKWLEKTPRHSQNRDQVRAEVQKLREIANQSARSAVATASRRDVRKQVIAKTIASVLSLGSGSAALLLDVSMLFGLVVLGIGLLFSADLALTVFRNWKQFQDLRKAASSIESDAAVENAETQVP